MYSSRQVGGAVTRTDRGCAVRCGRAAEVDGERWGGLAGYIYSEESKGLDWQDVFSEDDTISDGWSASRKIGTARYHEFPLS